MTASGPFVVTRRRPVAPDDDGSPFCAACSHYHEGPCPCPDCGRPTPCRDHLQDRSVSTPATKIVYREAFATLNEARRTACAEIRRRSNVAKDPVQPALDHAANVRESGGTIRLPKGDVIVVEATTDDELYAQAGKPAITYLTAAERTNRILTAWNAEYGIGIEERA